jgi:glyoxylase-like metal-dependent hydrolase (beta-lactamase superfamily II)
MKASLKTFKSWKGDCIFFLIDDDGKRFVTMIDCGKYTPEIKKHVEEGLGKHINILIVTHIDNDHLDGIVEMLEQTPDIKIGKILYNCNQLWNGTSNKQASESLKQDLLALRSNLPSRQTIDNGKIRAEKAITLAEILGQKEEWWNAWKKDEYITTETTPIALDSISS